MLVKRSCGQVPARYERHTLGEDNVRFADLFEEPINWSPISCSSSLRCSAAMMEG